MSAESYVVKAEKLAKGGIFGLGSDKEEASELMVKAANLYKLNKDWLNASSYLGLH
jgi:soluble NSF attachment protein (SNAP)-like